jgi:hypothetical protein
MESVTTAVITVAALCAGALVGSFLRHRLPGHHLRDDSKEVIKMASGMIATLVALVVGLLVSSAKSSFDDANDVITQAGAKAILLDRALRRYGPEATPIRTRMKEAIQSAVDRLWPKPGATQTGIAAIEHGTGMDEIQTMIEHLAPSDEAHRLIRTDALEICTDLVRSRWLLIEKTQSSLPLPFLAILIFWLTVLFVSLGLLAPRNATTVVCLLVCAVSMAAAIVLLIEMDQPLEGLIKASPGPLLKALSVIGG